LESTKNGTGDLMKIKIPLELWILHMHLP